MPDRWLSLGQDLDSAYLAATQDWLRYNRRGMDDEVAMTSTLRHVQIDVTLRPGRKGLVIISYVGRRQIDTDSYPFEVYATPFSAYRSQLLA